MKKSIFTVIVAVLMLGVTNVNAMTKDELLDKLTRSYEINGAVFQANASQQAQIERYIATNDISEADADVIAKKVDAAVEVIDKADVTSIKDLKAADKTKLTSLVNSISDETHVKISVTDTGVDVYNINGTKFASIDNSIVKKTNNNNVIVVSSLISLAGIAFVARKFF